MKEELARKKEELARMKNDTDETQKEKTPQEAPAEACAPLV